MVKRYLFFGYSRRSIYRLVKCAFLIITLSNIVKLISYSSIIIQVGGFYGF